MPSVQQILDYVDRYYPNQVSESNKIIDLDHAHKEIYNKISRLKHDYEIYSITTISGQLTYNLPSNCTIDNIISIMVSEDTTITTTTQWNEYKYAGLKEDVSNGNYYSTATIDTFCLITDGEPIDTDDLEIRIYYYPTPNSLNLVSDIPELDPQYHNILKYSLIQALATQGHNPDPDIANYWQQKFDEEFKAVKEDLTNRFNVSPINSVQAEEWW